jgi:hypothetical protein
MQAFRQAVQKYFFTLLMLMLAGGFAMLLAELLITNHTDGIQNVAVIASVAGLLLVLVAIVLRERAATLIAVLLLLLSVTGLIGTYEHLEEAEGDERAVAPRLEQSANQFVAYAMDEDDDEVGENQAGDAESSERQENEGGENEGEETPPPLAPLSLAGLSLMGVLTTLGAPKKEEAH